MYSGGLSCLPGYWGRLWLNVKVRGGKVMWSAPDCDISMAASTVSTGVTQRMADRTIIRPCIAVSDGSPPVSKYAERKERQDEED